MKNKKLLKLTECALTVSLTVILSLIKIIEMPMGGSVTLFSMLPVILISVKYGYKTGLSVGFINSVIQLFTGFASGNVFCYTKTALTVITVVIFDYIVPFSVIGFSGLFKKYSFKGIYAGTVISLILRFLCHYITGFTVWGQWATEGMSKYYYSLIYNGSFMLCESIMTLTALVIIIQIPQIRKITGINFKENI